MIKVTSKNDMSEYLLSFLGEGRKDIKDMYKYGV